MNDDHVKSLKNINIMTIRYVMGILKCSFSHTILSHCNFCLFVLLLL